jgi:hypothetical protein
MYCICCNKNNVTPFDGSGSRKDPHHTELNEEDLIWKKDKTTDGRYKTIDSEMISGGIIQIISAGYGSKHDGDQVVVAICDGCVTEKLGDATILYFDNYMGSSWTKEEIEKSKKKYRRRKNLDKLV